MAEPTDVQHLVKQLMTGASLEENKALLAALTKRAGDLCGVDVVGDGI